MSAPIGYAFWKHDTFPYVLGGAFTKLSDDGKVYVPSYQGWFVPIRVMSVNGGENLSIKIAQLQEEQRDAAKVVEIKFNRLMTELFGVDPRNK